MGRRKKQLFRVIIPNSLLWLLELNHSMQVSNYKLAHFISILTHHIYSNYPNGKYYFKKPITSVFLGKLYNKRYLSEVIMPLKEAGVIEVNDAYSADIGKCKEYGLNKDIIKEIINEEYTEVYITTNTLIRKINEWQQETLLRQIQQYRFIEGEAEMLLHLNIDSECLERLYIDRVEQIKQSNIKKKRIAIINALRHKEELLELNDARDLLDARVRYISGRVYHPLVQCPREYRKAVVDNEGQPYLEIDLRSSQAVFLCKVIAVALKHRLIAFNHNKITEYSDNLIEKIIPLLDEPINLLEEGVYPSDFIQFVKGVFFDDIYEEASPKNISQTASIQVGKDIYEIGNTVRISGSKTLVGEARNQMKEQFFKDIFFNYYNKENYGMNGQLSISSKYLEDFAKTYYTVYEFCRICAFQSKEGRKKSRELALLLQQTESKFFHQMIPSELKKEFNFFIVHDGIYVPQSQKEYVLSICEKTANDYFGITPHFKA